MTDPWLVRNSGQQKTSVENGTKENGASRQEREISHETPLEFEDDFAPGTTALTINNCLNEDKSSKFYGINNSTSPACIEPLPDSDTYLRGLERKLQKIKKGANLVEALAEKRNDCLRQLLHSSDPENNNDILALDQPLNNIEFYRHLQPIQALSVGELVHIVNYDQLQQEQTQDIESKREEREREDKSENAQ
ncbi:unnamed protein product [Ceratitis capitata]|uniref:(Mediterranean fruit fly) hypothetical protein n=1 Tax=Ceratitis capitata TaxID=7213 RepID=A0A811U165_CERCA|nr:unnamed protein product [Ceratitis capitata]